MTLASLQLPFSSPSLLLANERYTAHGMWVMAELVAKATVSFIAESKRTEISEEDVEADG